MSHTTSNYTTVTLTRDDYSTLDQLFPHRTIDTKDDVPQPTSFTDLTVPLDPWPPIPDRIDQSRQRYRPVVHLRVILPLHPRPTRGTDGRPRRGEGDSFETPYPLRGDGAKSTDEVTGLSTGTWGRFQSRTWTEFLGPTSERTESRWIETGGGRRNHYLVC